MLAVDNLNGIELCGRTICVDHVKQYKIPREYMYLSDSDDEKKEDGFKEKSDQEERKDDAQASDSDSSDAKARKREAKALEKFEKKLYKPTGPDGRGWGDFR
jgi:transposase